MPAKKLLGVWGRSSQRKIASFGMISIRKVYVKHIYKTEKVYVKSCTKLKISSYLRGGGFIKLFKNFEDLSIVVYSLLYIVVSMVLCLIVLSILSCSIVLSGVFTTVNSPPKDDRLAAWFSIIG